MFINVSSLKLKNKGIRTNIPPAGDGIPSKKLPFHDGSSVELTLNLANLNATATTYITVSYTHLTLPTTAYV